MHNVSSKTAPTAIASLDTVKDMRTAATTHEKGVLASICRAHTCATVEAIRIIQCAEALNRVCSSSSAVRAMCCGYG